MVLDANEKVKPHGGAMVEKSSSEQLEADKFEPVDHAGLNEASVCSPSQVS